jgi:ABC-type multidrug transport system fused ATPase/permease subunit
MNIILYLLLKFFKKEKFKIIFTLILTFIINILKINVISYITANIIQSIQKNDMNKTYQYSYYFIIVSMLFVLLYGLFKYVNEKIFCKLRLWIRKSIIKMLLLINNENFSDVNFLKLNIPMTRISSNVYYSISIIVNFIIPNLTLLIIIFIYFFYKNYVIGSIFLIFNIFILLYLYFNIENIKKYSINYEKKLENNESYITEILGNFDKIIFRGNIKEEINELSKLSNKTINAEFKFHTLINYNSLFLNIIIFTNIFLCIFYMIYLYYNKKIEITIFITFITILLLYRDFIIGFINNISDLVEFTTRSSRFSNSFKDLDKNYENIVNKKYYNYDLNFNKIEFKNIYFKYKNTDVILNNFNLKLELNTQKIIGIKGISGRGKSTLVKLLIKIYKYDGDILIDDINIEDIETDYLRKNIIYVNQNSKLFDKKIIENIYYGCNEKQNKECKILLDKILEFEKIKKLFKNIDFYNYNAGHGGELLSGGQRQILNLINGFIVPSKIVILDEPTNALDKDLKNEVINIIKFFKPYKKSIIIISHDSDIFDIFDETIQI